MQYIPPRGQLSIPPLDHRVRPRNNGVDDAPRETLMRTRHRPWIQRCLVVAVGLLAGLVVSAEAAEVVILKDGFVIQGTVTKETTSINDPATGKIFPMVKGNGLDMVDEGPKFIIFSAHAKQLGEVSKDVKLSARVQGLPSTFPGAKGSTNLFPAAR